MNANEKLDKKEFGKRFRQFRQHTELTQLELAKILGLTQTTITGIEKGKSFPSLPVLFFLAKRYSLSISWLVTGEGSMAEKFFPSLEQSISESLYNDEIKDMVLHMLDVPMVRDFILEQFVVFKLRNKSEIEKIKGNQSS